LAAFEISTHDIAIAGSELEMLRAQHPATGSVTYRLVKTGGPCGMTDLVGESVFVLRLLRRNLQALRDRTGKLNGEHNPLSPAIKVSGLAVLDTSIYLSVKSARAPIGITLKERPDAKSKDLLTEVFRFLGAVGFTG